MREGRGRFGKNVEPGGSVKRALELAGRSITLTFRPEMWRFVVSLVVWSGVAAWNSAIAQVHPTNDPPASANPEDSNAPIRKLSETLFEIGKVRLDKKEKSVSFPAVVNMREGNVEYLVVHTTGKIHESVLKAAVEPFHIHTAMLLLGAKGGIVRTVSPDKKSSAVNGDSIIIQITWTTNNATTQVRGEEVIYDANSKKPMNRGSWSYNGSRIIDGIFLAQRDGSIVSVIADPDSLVNNPRPERDNDEIWLANTNAIPPLNANVEVTFKLEASK